MAASGAASIAAFTILTEAAAEAAARNPGVGLVIPEVAIIAWGWSCIALAIWSAPDSDGQARWLEWDGCKSQTDLRE